MRSAERVALPPVAEILVTFGAVSRWQTGRGYDIMSAERYKRGRFSQITPPRWAEVRRLRGLPTAGVV